MKKILWLASWYPNRTDRFDGDFIQRHARAVAGFCRVHVICVVKVKQGTTVAEESVHGNLSEQVIYYRPIKTGIPLVDSFLSHRSYYRAFRKAIKEYVEKNGKPDRVHVHVALKAGLAALWIKRKWKVPYVLTEHWTGYLTEADERLEDLSHLQKRWIQKVMHGAESLTTVSDHLGKAIKRHFPFVQYRVIPNVADTEIFHPLPGKQPGNTKFIHVSNMNFQKNAEAILKGLSLLEQKEPGFIADFYGPIKPALLSLITEYGLTGKVFLRGEVPQPELAVAMQQADALILYSRFETFGCVLIEANASGVPVIVSDIEVFHEIIAEGVNGIFVKGEDAEKLSEKLLDFINGAYHFDAGQIARNAAQKFNFETVGRKIFALYEEGPAAV